MKNHSERIPLHVRVSKDFYGNFEALFMSEGDTFRTSLRRLRYVRHRIGKECVVRKRLDGLVRGG